MEPLGIALIGIGGALAGAGIHQHGIDVGTQWVRQNELPRERAYYYALGRQHQRREDAAELRQLRADMTELKLLVQQLQGKQQQAELVEAVKKALPPGGWADLWNSSENGQVDH